MSQTLLNLDGDLGVAPAGSASFSPCRRYRYELWRRWGPGEYVLFVMLNPSTADEVENDPTIRRCIDYAKRWGYGALCVGNLFAYRATDPREMKAQQDPVGPDNDATLQRLARDAGLVVGAWGKDGNHCQRATAVIPLLPRLNCLKRNQDGTPAHPLYQPAAAVLLPYP